MTNAAVIGAQWGDEGKGKVVDILAPHFSCVVRFQGGNNAGHSVRFEGQQFALHLLPSGVFCRDTVNLIGNGVVVDPIALLTEIDQLAQRGVELTPQRLCISDRAHLVMPYHRLLDQHRDADPGQRHIGTTGKGIGPAYEFKASRRGIRFCDAVNRDYLMERLTTELALAKRSCPWIESVQRLDAMELFEMVWPALQRLQPHVVDGVEFLSDLCDRGVPILFEGAQATLLDVDFGTYPYVTSSNSCAAGITAGAGVPARHLDRVIGITKAYATRVGEGPFPTELNDSVGELLRERGREFGTTTGRPRRCGWLDLVALRYACRVNGFDALAFMKLDVLDECERIGLCVGYRVGSEEITRFPASLSELQRAEPLWQFFPGWNCETSSVRQLDELPLAARNYIAAVEAFVNCPVDLVSVGPDRTETILRSDGVFSHLAHI